MIHKKLSVIIVNFNVEYFVLQTLSCAYAARFEAEKIYGQHSIEIFVVDNNSSDDSVKKISAFFPEVNLIANTDNKGFAKANNQALRQATGEYKLLLNPDTLIPENTFTETIAYMDAHPTAGALGVRMTDIGGVFAPESKRAVPTPMGAFLKISGLGKLFKTKHAAYQLNHIPEHEIADIEVVSGAFMLVRSSALDKAGLLDEDFFMYGEDIDLSFRILKAGFRNTYFPKITIIHYKGESSKQNTKRYVEAFYGAMLIFAKKHYSKLAFLIFAPAIILLKFFKKRFAKQKSHTKPSSYAQTCIVGQNSESINSIRQKLNIQTQIADIQNIEKIPTAQLAKMKCVCIAGEVSYNQIIHLAPKVSGLKIFYPKTNCLI
jgi:GT2 family glycosyltransferase